jgi:hypothetical protein
VRFLSQVYTIARGSVGGITYTANQFYQLIARARTAPVQPNTEDQAAVRSAMTAAADAWTNLSGSEQNLWELYGAATKWPGPLGEHTISGRLCFMAGYILARYVSDQGYASPTIDTSAPAQLDGFYNLKSVSSAPFVTASSTGVSVTFTSETAVDACVLVEISPGFPITRRRYKGPWNTASSQAVILSAPSSVVVDFTGLSAGTRYFMRVKAVADDAPLRVSPEFIVNSIAVTNP